ncbi:MAG TPA: hypothetical protein VGP48_10910 [Stellaceae bacterium]|jgi:hypothetical protein|nr:hypothetical protein [Stellaceae bacterium]
MVAKRILFAGATYGEEKGGRRALAPLLALPVLLFGLAAQADETFSVQPNVVYALSATTVEGTATKPLTGFDISYVDNDAGVYVLSDSSNAAVDILDLNDPRTSGVTLNVVQPQPAGCTLPAGENLTCNFQGHVNDPNATTVGFNDVSGPTGNMTVNHREIWAADAPVFNGPIVAGSYANDDCNASVKVVDLRTQAVTDVIDLGGCFRADEMAFDPQDQVALIASPSETDCSIAPCPATAPKVNFITLVSTKPNHKVLARIVFNGAHGTPNALGGIEQARWNPINGLFYIATPTDGGNASGAIAIVDPRKLRAVGKLELTNNCSPAGMFIGPAQSAVLGCGNGPVQVVDLLSGQVDALVPQVGQVPGCDEVWYDRGQNHYLLACGPATGPAAWVAGVIDAGGNGHPIKWDTNITTQGSETVFGASHSIAADNFTNRILVPMGDHNTLCGSAPGCVAAWVSPGDADDAPPRQTAENDGD